MSNFGQAVTAIVGGVVGFFVGGPTGALYGFEIGLLAGTVISPTQLPGQYGPRLTDGNTTTASVGDPINFGYGYFAVGGTVIWLAPCVEHSTTTQSGSKGSPQQSQTTYSYTQSIAIGLCEGRIAGARRIWENGELVYDTRAIQSYETSQVYAKRLAANTAYAATFVIYNGDETQTADPTIEGIQGVGNVPAYRGLAYIVYPDRKLRDDQGQRHPTFKFEVHYPMVGHYDFDPADTDLASIITLICQRCGYDPTQIDASTLTDTLVAGYSVQRVMAGRDALAPLKSVGLFDVAESALQLKFVKRGGGILRTLDITDIGVFNSSDDGSAPAVTVTEQQEVDLPRQLRVTYIAADNDYLDGEQLSPARYDTDAVNNIDVELAVCISDALAAQIAEILWMSSWTSRWTYNTALDQSQADVEPTDILEIPVLGKLQRVRVDKVDDTSQILRKLTLLSDDDGSYVSNAVAVVSQISPQRIGFLSGTTVILLDIPAISDDDNNAGIYALAYGDGTGNTWQGAVVYRSLDGDTFNQFGTLIASPPIGKLVANTPVGITTSWDDENYIDVTIVKGGFSSRTDDAVFTGANSLAIGANGRWEIVQFGTAEQLNPTTYRLSHLLRGRRGTEWAVGTGLLGDGVYGISFGSLANLSLQNAQIGMSIVYKSVTIGASYGSGVDQSFTGQGVRLKPFSPVDIIGEKVGSDLVISWTRRDRLGQELPDSAELLLSEVTESYEIDISAVSTPGAILRTLTSITPTVTYLAANITTDFGSPPAEFYIHVYQMSAVVGRGYPGKEIVP